MKRLLICLSILPLVPTIAAAEVRYDLKLEAAVKAVIAGKIGNIRPGFKYGQTFSIDGMRTGSARAAATVPRYTGKSWKVVGGDPSLTESTSGSFQTFSDGKVITPQQRKIWAAKTVSRVINF